MPLNPFSRRLLFGGLGLYWLVLVYQLGAQWSVYEQYNYGWAVPFLCLFLLWRNFTANPATNVSGSNLNPQPSQSRGGSAALPDSTPQLSTFNFQLLIVGAALLLLLPIRVLHEANPIWRLTSWSWAILLVTITLGLLQLIGGSRLRTRYSFAVAFFLVAVPWPTPVENFFIQGLMRLNVGVVIELLNLIGIPALQKGNVIELATGFVGVDEACSGIRSLQATLMLSLFFSAYYRLRWPRVLLLVASGAGLAFGFNILRTLLLSYVAARQGPAAIQKWHDPAGITILVGCFLGLWLVGTLLARRNAAAIPVSLDAAAVPPNHLSDQVPTPVPNSRSSVLRLAPYLLVGWFILVESSTELWFRAHENSGPEINWSVKWPDNNPTFQPVELSQPVRDQLQFDEGESARWRESDGTGWQAFYLRWQPARSLRDRVRVSLSKSHSPEICLRATGMTLMAEISPFTATPKPNLYLTFRRYLFDANGQTIRVFLSVTEDMEAANASGFFRTSHTDRIKAALAGSRNRGQRTLEIAIWGAADDQQAAAALHQQLEKMITVK